MLTDILRRHGVDPLAVLGSGMEATVYARDASTVLKLYHRPDVLADIRTLQAFYDLLDAAALSYALPCIVSVEDHGDLVATIERRMVGTPMARRLPHLLVSDLDDLLARYFDAILELQKVRLRSPLGRCKLFDPLDLSRAGDWHDFLRRYLDRASARLAPFVARDVRNWDAKRERLEERLREPYTGTVSVIHGDIFPGNFMMEDERIMALLDFGIMTMIGDPLWDVATGAVFFDMYDELGVHARDRCLEVVLDRLGPAMLPALYQYVMVYSVVGADAYDATCTDGHYRWCIDNLNNEAWWRAL